MRRKKQKSAPADFIRSPSAKLGWPKLRYKQLSFGKLVSVPTRNSIRMLSILYLNARSIVNKLCDLKFEIDSRKPAVVCVSETWLDDSVSSCFLPCVHLYDVFRSDRRNGRGGGVLILTLKSLSGSLFLASNENPSFEGVWVDLYCNNNRVRVGTIYRKPNSGLSRKDVRTFSREI